MITELIIVENDFNKFKVIFFNDKFGKFCEVKEKVIMRLSIRYEQQMKISFVRYQHWIS